MPRSAAIHYTFIPVFIIRTEAFSIFVHGGILIFGFTHFQGVSSKTQEETSASSV